MRNATTSPWPIARLDELVGYSRAAAATPLELRLDGNEGALPPAELLQSLVDAGPEVLRCYPSTRELETDLARARGVEPAQVLVTAGADEGLDRIFRAFLDDSRNFVVPEPTFEMLPRYGTLVGAERRAVPWLRGEFPTDAVLEKVDADTGAVFVVSPNNPTGLCARAADVERLATAAPHALMVLDAAYAEFAATDLTAAALAHDNAVVTRTLSKAWGLAGLRTGYVLAAAPLIEVLRKAGSPYSVAGPSVALARACLRVGDARVAEFVARIERERDHLSAALAELGGEVWPSQANFVLVHHDRADRMVDGLAQRGIAVRTFPDRQDLTGCVRITLPGEEARFARLSRAVREVLSEAGS